MSRCPRCHGFTRREPARVYCTACGREYIVAKAPAKAMWLQFLVDFALRPRSIECLTPGEDGWWPPAAPVRRR
jgi:hypothetical protein